MASSSLKIAFRVDASTEIGTGHVMRCLTLADSLKDMRCECFFICRDHFGNLISFIRRCGYAVVELPLADELSPNSAKQEDGGVSHYSWLGTSWDRDAQQTSEILGGASVDWLVLDHYALDFKWEKKIRYACKKLMVIDDLADRKHACDLLLDQNLGRVPADYKGLVSENCVVLLGPLYALLRPEFARLRDYSLERRRDPALNNVLISMGGVDKNNVTCEILDAIDTCQLSRDCEITVVIGQGALWADEVRKRASTMVVRVEVLVNVSDMASIMARCDLAIGAAGSTSWERCALGVPAIITVLADNQTEIANTLSDSGAAVLISAKHLAHEIFDEVNNFAYNVSALTKLSRAASEITDGKGAARVISIFLEIS